jgi:osmotically-inducible protein OsmY/uncharacterized protein YrrD
MEQFKFAIGAKVYGGENPCGKLRKVVVDPHTNQVTDLIVERGFLKKTGRVLPVSAVERTEDQGIYLDVACDDLENYLEYRQVDFTKPAPGWGRTEPYKAEHTVCRPDLYMTICTEAVVPRVRYRVHEGIPSTSEVIQAGTPVKTIDGDLGKVDHVLVNSWSGQITHLVVRKGLIPQYPVIPIDMVENVSEESIFVKKREKELEGLPRYTPRDDDDILTALQNDLDASLFDLSGVKATVENGIVRLMGQVRDMAAKRRAEAIARSVEGVIDIENVLDADTIAASQVTAALASDPRTSLAVIEVIDEQGTITLKGQVDSPEIREAAEEIVGEQPGVVSVINALQVSPDDDTRLFSPWLVAAAGRRRF